MSYFFVREYDPDSPFCDAVIVAGKAPWFINVVCIESKPCRLHPLTDSERVTATLAVLDRLGAYDLEVPDALTILTTLNVAIAEPELRGLQQEVREALALEDDPEGRARLHFPNERGSAQSFYDTGVSMAQDIREQVAAVVAAAVVASVNA